MSDENSTARDPHKSATSLSILACFSSSWGTAISPNVSLLTRAPLRSACRNAP
ncbi:hypothetical protein CH063_11409 [Colletotrichum higginsianum]|uniref:Uncharacterized protein n=1 Tax=Colletotrichum higginsianum (strain IMI 349063) TaxID=759273 RepID=H1VL93_COLHI|nr:hypothetical protein CH063_11409 [Colletotrichum higginsianum]